MLVCSVAGPMIESIVVQCPTREDRQHWIELLSQEQLLNQHGSNLQRSPTSISHVSCCTHPPYTRLTRFFARLVRKRVIHSELLKRLLYFQYIFKPDMSSVKMRKCYLVTYHLLPSSKVRSRTSSPLPLVQKQQVRPVRKSSTLKLDVRYVLDDTSPRQHEASTSMAVYSNEPPTILPEPNSRSLPPKVSRDSCSIIPNFDSVPYRVLRSREMNADLSNLCDSSEDSKNWKSLGNQQQQQQTAGLKRGDCEIPTASPRSSDSGMADSFQHHSAELGSCYAKFCTSAALHSESENDENKFENQCICTSPFGSSASSQTSPSVSKSLLTTRPTNRLPSDEVFNSSAEEASSDEEDLDKCTCKVSEELEKRFAKLTPLQQKHLTQPLSMSPKKRPKRPLGHKIHKIEEPKRKEVFEEENEEDEPAPQVFTSGLYAHWWLKKTLPISDQGKLLLHGMAAFFYFYS